MTPADGSGRKPADWTGFSTQWVYGTEIPSYKFEYQLSPDGTTISPAKSRSPACRDDFKMPVPIYVDFGKGWVPAGLGLYRRQFNSSI